MKIITFGCRLNAFESEVIKKQATQAQLDSLEGGAFIFNTCAVTAEAVRQAKQAIRKVRRENPEARIIVTGCAAQVQAQDFASMAEVDLVLGNQDKLEAHAYRQLPDFGVNQFEKVRVNDIMEVRRNAPHLIDALEGKTRAFVQVQNGCDHRCTFCIIPYSRGPSRSVPLGAVVEQVQHLTQRGYKEVVLTGVDLTSYGPDLPGSVRLRHLVEALLKHAPLLQRLRLSSLDSIEVDAGLMDLFASEPRLMPHLHLSLQAGDNMILKRMKRRHTRQQAIDFCHALRQRRPEIVFGADIIAGFPTESDEMFENTRALIQECGLTHVHVFPFSAREKTPAARMPQCRKEKIKERAAILRQEAEHSYQKHLSRLVGSVQKILVEREGFGRTEDYTLAQLEGAPVGEIVPCTIIGHNGKHLLAHPVA